GATTMISIAAGLLGGAVCAVVTRRCWPAIVLSLAVLLPGVWCMRCAYEHRNDPIAARTAEVPVTEVMSKIREPLASSIAHPLLGFGGVLAGAMLVRFTCYGGREACAGM